MIINLTPHPIHIVDDAGNVVHTFETSGIIARLAARTVAAEPINGIPTSRTVFGEPENLPEPQVCCNACCQTGSAAEIDFNGISVCCEAGVGKVWLVVSQIIKSALPDRDDLLVPAEVVRDKAGTIIGCRSLGR